MTREKTPEEQMAPADEIGELSKMLSATVPSDRVRLQAIGMRLLQVAADDAEKRLSRADDIIDHYLELTKDP
jgi:hypothetical protein